MNRTKKPKNSAVMVLSFFVLGLIFLVAIISLPLYFTLKAPQPSSDQTVNFVIEPSETLTSISLRLKDQNLIQNPSAFKFAVVFQGLAQHIQAGNFSLSSSMSAFDIAQQLTRSHSDDIQVTLIEGWRREEIAATLNQTFAARDLDFNSAEFLSLTPNLEGQLFPDTYRFAPSTTAPEVITTLTHNFTTKVTRPLAQAFTSSPYSTNQILTMASIIEREARGEARPIIAGILWKRLEADWPLQADATLQYIKGYSNTNQTWWPTPLAIDKQLASPYNTYLHPGLPPAPICNPSLSSIQAALFPQNTDYWYYLTDNESQMHYATTYDQHQININRHLR